MEMTFVSFSLSLDITFNTVNSDNGLLNDLFLLFFAKDEIDDSSKTLNIKPKQNVKEVRDAIDKFIEKYKILGKSVYKLRTYFSNLKEGEYFLFVPTYFLSDDDYRNKILCYLSSLNNDVDYNKILNEQDALFGELRKQYKVLSFNNKTRKHIGEPDKSKRVCRFCGNTRSELTFRNRAHAISEALGNKSIILNEECDRCNSYFGESGGIEESLINFLQPMNVFFDVKAKNGVPIVKGRNFELSSSKNNNIHIKYSSKIESKAELLTKNFLFETNKKIVLQDIYRTICKFAISVIPSHQLPKFQDTIKWINREIKLKRLPKVSFLSSYQFFKSHPSIVVYLSKGSNNKLPFAIGEFHYTFMTIVFIIPLVKGEKRKFTSSKTYDNYWKFFKHFSSIQEWEFWDLSSTIRKNMAFNMKFNLDPSIEK